MKMNQVKKQSKTSTLIDELNEQCLRSECDKIKSCRYCPLVAESFERFGVCVITELVGAKR